MIRYREILRLAGEGFSQREIARSCGCAKSTVANVVERAHKVGICWPLGDEFTDAMLSAKLYPKKKRADTGKCPIDFEHIASELRMRGTTRALLWQEYRDSAESVSMEPYSYTHFCEMLRQWQSEHVSPTMHIEHKAGFEIQVDWVISVFTDITHYRESSVIGIRGWNSRWTCCSIPIIADNISSSLSS